jgi:DnaJ-class molecular chaperone
MDPWMKNLVGPEPEHDRVQRALNAGRCPRCEGSGKEPNPANGETCIGCQGRRTADAFMGA